MSCRIILLLSAFIGGCVSSGMSSKPILIHKVRSKGETLSAISRYYTGSSRNWPKIKRANPGLDVRKIQLGSLIAIPKELVITDRKMPPKEHSKTISTGIRVEKDRRLEELIAAPDSNAPDKRAEEDALQAKARLESLIKRLEAQRY